MICVQQTHLKKPNIIHFPLRQNANLSAEKALSAELQTDARLSTQNIHSRLALTDVGSYPAQSEEIQICGGDALEHIYRRHGAAITKLGTYQTQKSEGRPALLRLAISSGLPQRMGMGKKSKATRLFRSAESIVSV